MVSENQRRTYAAFQQTRPTSEDRQWFFVGRTDAGLARIRDARGNIREAFLEGNRAITEGEPVLFIPPRPGQSLGVVQIEYAELPPVPQGEMQQFIGAIQYLDGKDDPQPGQQRGTGDLARVKYIDPDNGEEVDKGLFEFNGTEWVEFSGGGGAIYDQGDPNELLIPTEGIIVYFDSQNRRTFFPGNNIWFPTGNRNFYEGEGPGPTAAYNGDLYTDATGNIFQMKGGDWVLTCGKCDEDPPLPPIPAAVPCPGLGPLICLDPPCQPGLGDYTCYS